jgi:prepilin-type N-terminal cleavage/methylation domain-containing protein
MRLKKSFTLIEILVTLALISSIAVVMGGSFRSLWRDRVEKKEEQQLKLWLKETELNSFFSKKKMTIRFKQNPKALMMQIIDPLTGAVEEKELRYIQLKDEKNITVTLDPPTYRIDREIPWQVKTY